MSEPTLILFYLVFAAQWFVHFLKSSRVVLKKKFFLTLLEKSLGWIVAKTSLKSQKDFLLSLGDSHPVAETAGHRCRDAAHAMPAHPFGSRPLSWGVCFCPPPPSG